jgi:hypothetical protein
MNEEKEMEQVTQLAKEIYLKLITNVDYNKKPERAEFINDCINAAILFYEVIENTTDHGFFESDYIIEE